MGWAADDKDQSDIEKRIQNAANVLDEIMAVKDKAIPDKIMGDAECIAVVPSMVKVAIGFGGNHGKGVATCKTANGWSAPAPFSVTGGSWGLQIGGQAVDLVVSDVLRTNELQVWFLSEHLVEEPLVKAEPIQRFA